MNTGYKYCIIEYSDKSITYRNGKIKYEVYKSYHTTNSKILKWIIILVLKFSKINYKVVK